MIVFITKRSIIIVITLALIFFAICASEQPKIDYPVISSGVIDQDIIADFLLKYGWHTGGTIYFENITIPLSFSDKSRDLPEGIYWAFNNELSKDIGLDVSPYKGKEVYAYIVPLKEKLSYDPINKLRAIIISFNESIIGAWLDRADTYGFTCSLKGNSFGSIVDTTWGEWLIDNGLVDPVGISNEEKAKLSPSDIIKKYVEAINIKDFDVIYGLLSKANQTHFLFRDVDKGKLYNSTCKFDKRSLLNMEEIEIKKITILKNYEFSSKDQLTYNLLNRNIYKTQAYTVQVKTNAKQTISDDEDIEWLIVLVKETKDSSWEIEDEKTYVIPSGTVKTTISEVTPSISSGATIIVPWENDEDFKNVQQEHDTFILASAYRTVLRDPFPGEEGNVHLAARLLAGTMVNSGQVFSQNQAIGPYTQSKGFQKGPTYLGPQLTTTVGGGVCKLSSTLYNVAALSNLQIIERHAHSMPVPYVPYGQDATVAYGSRDFRFKNNTPYPILIWAEGIDNILYIAFYSKIIPPKVQWHHEILQTKKAPTIYKKNPDLPAGSERILIEGMDGATVKSWLTIETFNGEYVIRNMGNSHYNPMPHIIEKGK